MNRLIVSIAVLLGFSTLSQAEELKEFHLDHVAKYDWGRLAAVYDQPSFQRLTFENDTTITIVQVGLAWDNKENTYRPSIRQVISISKGDFPKADEEQNQ